MTQAGNQAKCMHEITGVTAPTSQSPSHTRQEARERALCAFSLSSSHNRRVSRRAALGRIVTLASPPPPQKWLGAGNQATSVRVLNLQKPRQELPTIEDAIAPPILFVACPATDMPSSLAPSDTDACMCSVSSPAHAAFPSSERACLCLQTCVVAVSRALTSSLQRALSHGQAFACSTSAAESCRKCLP